jgi:hypothetical protein
MTEQLLQFIWRFQYFNNKELQLDSGEHLQIIFSGQHNFHQGPDFLEAKIKIGQTTLVGNIELHIRSSDWKKHAHTDDPNYKNIILHVVWVNDQTIERVDFPTIAIQNRVPKLMLNRYEDLVQSSLGVPCEKMLHIVNDLVWVSWKQRLMVDRLLRKFLNIEKCLQQTNHHWEETFWWLLARNFGIKVNAEAFEAMAKTVSVNVLAKHKNQIHQLEAILLGQCRLLEKDFEDAYPKMLQKEYAFLKKKHKLEQIGFPIHFLRMRPSNFPNLRLAQLAMLVHRSSHLFSKIKEMGDIQEVKKILTVEANDYWDHHFIMDTISPFQKKVLGKQMVENIIINTIVPILFAYGHLHKEESLKEKAIKWMEAISPEKNNITQIWKTMGIEIKNAFDSQSLIELKTQFCDLKRCLECSIGNRLLKSSL